MNLHPAAVFAAVSERSWLIIELTRESGAIRITESQS